MKTAEVIFEFDEKEIEFNQEIANLLLYNKGFSASSNSIKIKKFTILNKDTGFQCVQVSINNKKGGE